MTAPFSNEQVSFDDLPKVENVYFQPIPKQYLNVVYLNNAILTIIFGVLLMVIVMFNEWVRTQMLILVYILVLFTGLLFWMSFIGFQKKGYAVRKHDIVFRRGILATTTTIIPFNRIQHVAIHEGFFSRMYELSELQIYTAGGSSSDLHIPGLPKSEAEQIKTFLLNQISSFASKETTTINEIDNKIEEVEHIKEENQTELPDNDEA